MKRQRPGPPPLPTRLQVIKRQAPTFFFDPLEPQQQQLDRAIKFLFGDAVVHLDHEPALRRRAYNSRIKKVAARYTPNAHDPDYLMYRPFAAELEGSHHIKTQVRGDHGQFPDRVLIKRERRRERKLAARPCRWCGHAHVNGCPKLAKAKSKRRPMGDRERKAMSLSLRQAWAAGRSRWPQGRKIQNRPFQKPE